MAKEKKADNAEAVSADFKDHEFEIAKGKSVTSLKGILTEGMPCEPGYFSGGEETFNNLGEKGYITHVGEK